MRRPPLKKLIGLAIVLAIGVYLAHLVWESRVTVMAQMRHMSAPWAVLATVLLVLYFFSHPWLYLLLLRRSGEHAGFADVFSIYFQARAGRYIPGKFWSIAGLVVLGHRKGISAARMSVVAVSGTLINLAAAGVHSLLTAQHYLKESHVTYGLVVVSIVACVTVVAVLQTDFVQRRIVLLAAKATGEEGPPVFPLALRNQAAALFLFWASWVVYGAAGACLVLSFFPVEPAAFFSMNSMFAFAYLMGYCAVLVPGGIGIQEGIITWMLAGFMAPGMAAAIAILLRIWMSLVEFLLIGAAYYMDSGNNLFQLASKGGKS